MKQDDIFIFLYKSYYRQNHAAIKAVFKPKQNNKKPKPNSSENETKTNQNRNTGKREQ